MNTSVTDEIRRIKERLEEISHLRDELPSDDFSTRADLLDEEHELQARVGELTDLATASDANLAETSASSGTDLARTPELPRD